MLMQERTLTAEKVTDLINSLSYKDWEISSDLESDKDGIITISIDYTEKHPEYREIFFYYKLDSFGKNTSEVNLVIVPKRIEDERLDEFFRSGIGEYSGENIELLFIAINQNRLLNDQP